MKMLLTLILKKISEYFIFQLQVFSKSLDLVNSNTSVSLTLAHMSTFSTNRFPAQLADPP